MRRNSETEGRPAGAVARQATPVAFPGAGLSDASGGSRSIEVAEEVPVSIVYGTVPYAVMMATPADLDDFVCGFSLTEGIVESAGEIRGVTTATEPDGVVVTVDLAPDRFREHLARRRNLTGRTSCGLCGVEDREQLPLARRPLPDRPRLSADALGRAVAALDGRQPLNALTRSVHAAAWCDPGGDIVLVREDVGRHNALDKLIGACLGAGIDPGHGFLFVTSRASFEMVEKAAIFGAGALVAISAPTSLAIERATRLGLTLVAVARRDGALLFTGALAPGDRAATHQPATSHGTSR